LGPPNISEIERARKLKLKTPLDIVTYAPLVQKKIPLGEYRGTRPPNVNFGFPEILETTRARMLKLKAQLDVVKYSLWVQKFISYGATWGVGPPSVNLGPPNIIGKYKSQKVEIENAIRHSKVLALGTKNVPLGGVHGEQGPLT